MIDSDLVMRFGAVVVVLSAALLIVRVLTRNVRQGIAAAEEIAATQFHVVGEAYFEALAREVDDPVKARRVREMTQAVRDDGYVLRKGHAIWMLSVLDGKQQDRPVPAFEPPADRPYDLRLDPQVPAVAAYMQLLVRGRLVEAERTIAAAARAGSPIAMSFFGAGLVHDKFPGGQRVAEGIEWLQRASDATGGTEGSAELGELYLLGTGVPQDTAKGMALIERAAAAADDDAPVRWVLAKVYRRGLHGVVPQPDRAMALVLPAARPWRRVAHRAGLRQWRWLDRHLAIRDAIQTEVSAKSPLELQSYLRRTMSRRDRG